MSKHAAGSSIALIVFTLCGMAPGAQAPRDNQELTRLHDEDQADRTPPDDFLLAHEFCVIAIIKGKNDREARWLAASSEDRFLMNIQRPQRFGTQFRSAGDPDGC